MKYLVLTRICYPLSRICHGHHSAGTGPKNAWTERKSVSFFVELQRMRLKIKGNVNKSQSRSAEREDGNF